jgi:heptosyltransferase I
VRGRADGGGPTILLVRLGARGDVVFASPLVRAIRRAHPGARILWVVEPAAADLIRHHPELDRVIVWPRAEWERLLRGGRLLSLLRAVRDFAALLRAEAPDLAIDLHGLFRSAAVARMSGAAQVIGLGAREGSRLLVHRVVARDAGDRSRISSEYLHLAGVLGWETRDFQCEVHPGPEDRAAVWAALHPDPPPAHPAPDRAAVGRYAVLAPFTTRPQKHWREDRWAPLAEQIHTRTGLTPVLLGGPTDREAAARIMASASGSFPLVSKVGSTTLGEAAAWVEGAALVVGVDTGLTHLGIAMDRPVVALFGSTRPYTHAPGRRLRVVYEPLPCAPCRTRPTCGGRFDCMERLEVERVAGAVDAVLAAPRGGGGEGGA